MLVAQTLKMPRYWAEHHSSVLMSEDLFSVKVSTDILLWLHLLSLKKFNINEYTNVQYDIQFHLLIVK